MPADAAARWPRLVDLTHPVRDGMQVYPGDPAVEVVAALTLGHDGVAVERLAMGSHTGTHVDAPSHTVEGGRTMAQVVLDELVGEARVLRVPGLADGAGVGWEALEAAGPVPDAVPPIVVVATGWSAHFGTERALRHPWLEGAAARELVRRGMRVLAVDALSPDATGEGAAEGTSFPVHEAVLGADGCIVENLVVPDDLPARIRIGIFPLRLGADGAPVRAVAFLD